MLKLRHICLITLMVLMLWGLTVEQIRAQWPPFKYEMSPSYEDGKITYQIEFYNNVDFAMEDLTFKIPLPKGTRFIEAYAFPVVEAKFDGAEIIFTSPFLDRDIKKGDAYFIVEVVDPTIAVVSTHTWITWQGIQPGDYLDKEVPINVTRQPLDWKEPEPYDLELKLSATVTDGVVTYIIYPRNIIITKNQMLDVKIRVPVPVGTTFLSAEAPPSFVSGFDGQEVTFSALEIKRRVKLEPLKVNLAIVDTQVPELITHVWATWKYAGSKVIKSNVSQSETTSDDLLIYLDIGSSQLVYYDISGDVPLPNYDLTSVAFGRFKSAFKINFDTIGELGPIGGPQRFTLDINTDCNDRTGDPEREDLGAEYQVVYKHQNGKAEAKFWDEAGPEKKWRYAGKVSVANPANNKRVTLLVPFDLFDLEDYTHFCWKVRFTNATSTYTLPLIAEWVEPPQQDLDLTSSQEVPATAPVETSEVASSSKGTFIKSGDIWRYLPGWSEPAMDWKMVDFNDVEWFSGPGDIGYGNGQYATFLNLTASPAPANETPVLAQQVITESGVVLAMFPSSEARSFFMRRTFEVDNPTALTQLKFQARYEGGFIAYLNGLEVARQGLGEADSPVSYDAIANGGTRANNRVSIDLSNYISSLVSGANVLAIQVHQAADQFNFSMAPELTWKSDSAAGPIEDPEATVSTPAASPTPVSPPDPSTISGKLAVPLDNGRAGYEVHIFSLPEGQEIIRIPNARQPNFHFDGQRLLINHQGGGEENTYEYNLADGTERQVTDAPEDWHPFYDPSGYRLVYGNAKLAYGQPERVYSESQKKDYFTGVHKPFIFVQCGLLPPHQEKEPHCRDIPSLGVLIPAGQSGEIQGTNPVWTSNDMIAFKACNSWSGFGKCGIYLVPSSSTKGLSDGYIPRQLTQGLSDTPTDTKSDLIAFMSTRDGNWEAYVMDLNGDGVKNLSDSPNSSDGLPTISPDGNWLAFISDRDGLWAVWVAPIVGGPAQKLFDLPVAIPWGTKDLDWTNERISWGP